VADSTTGLSDKDIKKLTLNDAVNVTLYYFQAKRQHQEDGMFLYPLCPYLKTKLGIADASPVPRIGGGGGMARGGSAYPTNAVRNPRGCLLFKITSRNIWQVFLDHAREAPVPNLCCCYHLTGVCNKVCFFKALHITLTWDQTSALGKWVESCRARTPHQPADTAKKPKLVGYPENAYAVLTLAPLLTLRMTQ
jgi:hypothetical protein